MENENIRWTRKDAIINVNLMLEVLIYWINLMCEGFINITEYCVTNREILRKGSNNVPVKRPNTFTNKNKTGKFPNLVKIPK